MGIPSLLRSWVLGRAGQQRFRNHWLAGLLVGALGGACCGCAFFDVDDPVATLRERILAPAGLLPAAPRDSAETPHSSDRERLPVPPSPTGDRTDKRPADQADQPKASDDPAVRDGPLTLDQAIALALRCNPRLEAVRERIGQAEGGEQVAFADFLPDARLSYRRIQGTPESEPFVLPTLPTSIGNVAFGGSSDRFDRTELNVQWTLWDFGLTAGKFGQATAAVEIARLQYFRARQTVAFDVAVAYFTVLRAGDARRIAEAAAARAESILRDARNFLERGTAVQNDVLRAEVLLAETQLQLVKARTAEAGAVAGLNQAIGLNISCPTRVAELPKTPPFGLSLSECLQLAADNRKEFGVVLQAIRSARLGTGVAQAEFLPRIIVGGVAAHQDEQGAPDTNLVAGGINLELALFEGGRRLGRLHSAEAEVRVAAAQAKDVCDRIAYEVTLAYLDIDDARQRLVLSQKEVAGATENLRVERGLFDRGDATPTDIADAELAITRAQQNESTAEYDYQVALARLAYATGVRNDE